MRYWVYLDGEVPGSYTPADLAAMPGFSETSLVCPAEGGIQDRNWRRAGQFSDILDALRKNLSPESPPQSPARGPQDLLDDASRKIFMHVTDLMKELENRREERALAEDLKRQVEDLKNEILAARERNQYLESRAGLIKGFEDREKKFQELLARARAEADDLKTSSAGLESQLRQLLAEMEKARARETGLCDDVQRHAQIAEELSKQLGEKELTLARAFGVIRKLEQALALMVPSSPAPAQAPEPPVQAPAPAQEQGQSAPAPTPLQKPLSVDTGQPEAPIAWPPEGEVKPLPSPLQTALEKIFHWDKP